MSGIKVCMGGIGWWCFQKSKNHIASCPSLSLSSELSNGCIRFLSLCDLQIVLLTCNFEVRVGVGATVLLWNVPMLCLLFPNVMHPHVVWN